MTGEQKPGGLEVVAWLYSTVSGEGKALVRPLQYLNGEEVLGVALTPAEPAEARIREVETACKVFAEKAENAIQEGFRHIERATAVEAKLAKAKEALEEISKMTEALILAASALVLGGKEEAARIVEAIATDFEGHARQTLAALQQEGE